MNLGRNCKVAVYCAVVGVGMAAGFHLPGCGGAPTAFFVNGPASVGNDVPTLTIEEPTMNVTRGRGDNFLIRWTDSDSDSNAEISFALVDADTNVRTFLVRGISENDFGLDSGPDSFTAGTSLVPIGEYYVEGIISDGANPSVSVFAMTDTGTVRARVLVNIVDPGTQPPTEPPSITVIEPGVNLSVAQDDQLAIAFQPTQAPPNMNLPYDQDSNVTVYLVLDLDSDPTNDDPANPTPTTLILLRQLTILEDAFDLMTFPIDIDLNQVPPRPAGEPYFVRATIDDLTNPRVHSYAPGTINVVQLASGFIDLFDIGRTRSGAKVYGFTPGANVGSRIASVGDFDGDGTGDFVIVGQFANPRNFGPVGEAYLIYGMEDRRFGGDIPANSVSTTVSGVILEGPPVRRNFDGSIERLIPGDPFSLGITDVNFLPDVTGDNRPEILMGLPRVHGCAETMDYDTGDSDVSSTDNSVDIEIVVTQGEITVQEGTNDPVVTNPTYNGVEDTFISSQSPNTAFGSSAELDWQNQGAGNRIWALIKFSDLRDEIQDQITDIDLTSIEATLELRVFRPGVDARIHQCFTDFDEQTTFATFAVGGGEPVPDVDYELGGGEGAMGLDAVAGGDAETIMIDVGDMIRLLLDRELLPYDEELRFIIVADTDEDNLGATAVRSSEFQFNRPTLRINYTRLNTGFGSFGCYSDQLVNNYTDTDGADVYAFAGGMAVVINSTNRDNSGFVNVDRLEATSIALELVGQRTGWFLDENEYTSDGVVRARADNVLAMVKGNDPEQPGHISGARFVAGFYDFVDHLLLRQGPREDRFGQNIAPIGDLNNDGIAEVIISAPRNELYMAELTDGFGSQSTHLASTAYSGSLAIIPGDNFNTVRYRELGDVDSSTAVTPWIDHYRAGHAPHGNCSTPFRSRHFDRPFDSFEVFAEATTDNLGNGQSAGDFNLDGVDDILCGAPLNDRIGLADSGATYIIYGRSVISDIRLANADDRLLRAPMLRIRGGRIGDQIGWRQATGLDVNGDRIDDVFFSSPRTDFGGVVRPQPTDTSNLTLSGFDSCRDRFEAIDPDEQLFSDGACKRYDFDNDGDVQDDDRCVFCCLTGACSTSGCMFGTTPGQCFDNLVDNGFVGVVFGGVFTDGDREISQLAGSDLAGTVFYGSGPGHLAGYDVSSAADFNEDGFGDLLIAAPGETRLDSAARERLGVVYLVFGGTHLTNTEWNLSQVGSDDLPGIVFLSPYVKGAPNEAAPKNVGFLGDINRDGFGDIAIGLPDADFIDLSFPQGPNAPESDASVGRRSNVGNAYIVYGNNSGSNRGTP